MRVPFGVVGIIYEARPNVTADAAGICLKSGNAALLRGSSSALDSNRRWSSGAARRAAEVAELPVDAVQLVEGAARGDRRDDGRPRPGRRADPARRGRPDQRRRATAARVPVIETGIGNCHLFVDASADQEHGAADPDQRQGAAPQRLQRRRDAAGARRRSPTSSCRAHWLRCAAHGVTVHGTDAVRAYCRSGGARPVRTSSTTSTCLSTSPRRGRLARGRDRAHPGAHHRASRDHRHRRPQRRRTGSSPRWTPPPCWSTRPRRFVDGGEFGFGAEIGISTQKLHARGPMGLPEMTSTKYVVTGAGQIRA